MAAVLWLALVQILSAAHAYSGDAAAPDHSPASCVICLNGHHADDVLPAIDETPSVPAASPDGSDAPPKTLRLVGDKMATGPPTRAPPSA